MARTNTYTCKTCGTTFDRCVRCMIDRPDFDAESFCERAHADIYAILSKHGCNLITADEALAELAAYNLDNIQLADDILAHVEKIKSEATPVRATVKVVEESHVNQSNKKAKKKW